jgi:hypothetical protein
MAAILSWDPYAPQPTNPSTSRCARHFPMRRCHYISCDAFHVYTCMRARYSCGDDTLFGEAITVMTKGGNRTWPPIVTTSTIVVTVDIIYSTAVKIPINGNTYSSTSCQSPLAVPFPGVMANGKQISCLCIYLFFFFVLSKSEGGHLIRTPSFTGFPESAASLCCVRVHKLISRYVTHKVLDTTMTKPSPIVRYRVSFFARKYNTKTCVICTDSVQICTCVTPPFLPIVPGHGL